MSSGEVNKNRMGVILPTKEIIWLKVIPGVEKIKSILEHVAFNHIMNGVRGRISTVDMLIT